MPSGAKRVLIVEDEFLIALNLCDLVSRLGHEPVGPVRSVREALEMLSSRVPDSALLDCRLADGLSAAVAEALRARRVPFAWLTGYEETDLPAPGEPVLRKPVTAEDLTGALTAMLDGVS
ncbi:MAG TPA: response regulator [Azospirillaceae bacterium]|nr:response regulator [Azospirillaceae bacterium]